MKQIVLASAFEIIVLVAGGKILMTRGYMAYVEIGVRQLAD